MNQELGNFEKLRKIAEEEVQSAMSADDLFVVEKKYLGRTDGEVVKLLRGLKDLSPEEKRILGPSIQQTRSDIEALVLQRRRQFDEQTETAQSRFFDHTLPGLSINRGTAHPV
ncbi:MAG TPA: hypothetical protein VJC11_00575, partial [Patescibacteria group bacterium]|nr:hypothetical protein [Patescibacteria group bacterium]